MVDTTVDVDDTVTDVTDVIAVTEDTHELGHDTNGPTIWKSNKVHSSYS